jgi:hypothetical protein
VNTRRSFFRGLLAAALAPAIKFFPAPARPEPTATPFPRDENGWQNQYLNMASVAKCHICGIVITISDCDLACARLGIGNRLDYEIARHLEMHREFIFYPRGCFK